MDLTFLIPLSAAIVLFILSYLVVRQLIRTKLITLLYLAIFPIAFTIWMISRIIMIISIEFFDPFRLNHSSYIIGAMFLVFFTDLASNGKFSWRSLLFSFYGGSLIMSALFIDKYVVGYIDPTGWVQMSVEFPIYYIFLFFFEFLVIFVIFGGHLIQAYLKNVGDEKKKLRTILIIFFLTSTSGFLFTALRTARHLDYFFVNSLDALFMALGFGFIAYQYLKYPHLFHLDVLDVQLYGIVVYDRVSGILLYSYEFKSFELKSKELIPGFFTGINILFKEILMSNQVLKEVHHGSNIILFEEGKNISMGLITSHSTLMTSNWLFQFRVQFEREFEEEINIFLQTQALTFEQKPDTLVRKIFLFE